MADASTTAKARPARDNTRGMLWMLGSVAAASAMSVGVRIVSHDLDSRMIVLLRAGLTLAALLLAIAALPHLRARCRIRVPGLHLVRGVLIAVSIHLGFYTFAHIPLATATVLFFTAPIFATIIAALTQRERVGPRRIAAVAAGFLGALIILRPGFGTLHPAMLAALGASLLFAGALSLSRRVAESDGTFAALLSSVAITVVLSLPVALPHWALPPNWPAWLAMGLVIAGGVARNIADIEAYRHGEAGVLAPLAYLRIVVIGVAGYLLFDERLDGPTLLGAGAIVGSTLFIARREAALKRVKAPAVP